jgi:hypothetical protein
MEDSVSPQLNIEALAVRGYVWSPFGTPLKMMFTVLVLVLYKVLEERQTKVNSYDVLPPDLGRSSLSYSNIAMLMFISASSSVKYIYLYVLQEWGGIYTYVYI